MLKRGRGCSEVNGFWGACDNAAMPDAPTPPPLPNPWSPLNVAPAGEKMLCERCGAEMYRMHAVWRCTECGFKTDCCGW